MVMSSVAHAVAPSSSVTQTSIVRGPVPAYVLVAVIVPPRASTGNAPPGPQSTVAVCESSEPASAYVAVISTGTPCSTVGLPTTNVSVGAALLTVTWAVSVSHSPSSSQTSSVAVKAASSAAWKPAWAVGRFVSPLPSEAVQR